MFAPYRPSDGDLAPYRHLGEREIARIVLLLLVEERLARQLAPLRLKNSLAPAAADPDHPFAATG
jgi:hypothetical protein